MNILRRLPLSRLLLACGLAVAIGVSATALALAVGSGPVPPSKPLAQAVHDALGGPAVEGVSANVKLTNHLLEGANLASGGQGGELASSPLLNGATGRLWISKDGRMRLELQAEKGDTQILYDGHTITLYDAATNTVYRYTVPASSSTGPTGAHDEHGAPSLAKIEEGISKLRAHAGVSEATPTDVGGQPAYTVRVSPKEGGSMLAGAELSFDSVHGLPLRAAVYSTTSSSPVIELAATEVSYGPVSDSVFSFAPPTGAKVKQIAAPSTSGSTGTSHPAHQGKVTLHGHGASAIAVAETPAGSGKTSGTDPLEGLPKVKIGSASASELRTALGTVLTFERSGVRYIVAGSVEPSAVEALARGL